MKVEMSQKTGPALGLRCPHIQKQWEFGTPGVDFANIRITLAAPQDSCFGGWGL